MASECDRERADEPCGEGCSRGETPDVDDLTALVSYQGLSPEGLPEILLAAAQWLQDHDFYATIPPENQAVGQFIVQGSIEGRGTARRELVPRHRDHRSPVRRPRSPSRGRVR